LDTPCLRMHRAIANRLRGLPLADS
jgi:hypothetical protein